MEERVGKHQKEQLPKELALAGIKTHSKASVIKTARYSLMGKQQAGRIKSTRNRLEYL